MRQIILANLLLSVCAVGSAASSPAQSLPEPSVEIIASYEHTPPTLTVSLRAVAVGLEPPLKYRWLLGNGKQWLGPEPWPQSYDPGRYDVLLTVTDANGRIKKASVAIDSKSMGCAV